MGPATDYARPVSVEEVLRSRGIVLHEESPTAKRVPLTAFRDGAVESLVFRPIGAGSKLSRELGEAYLCLLARTLKTLKPEIVATYGGHWLGGRILETARSSGAKTVVFLHNLAYQARDYFQNVDLTIVPSHFASGVYYERLKLETSVAAPVIEWENVLPESSSPRDHVLFVNPEPAKGVYFFSQIAKELWKIRPDIPFLVVGGRSEVKKNLFNSGVDWKDVRNLYMTPNTPTPRDFYRRAKLTLVPSLVPETFGRVVVESLCSGAPVITSTRGALLETVGDSGVLLSIPSKYKPESQELPTPEEVAPWVRKIVTLWDDAELYRSLQARGLRCAEKWSLERSTDRHEELLFELLNK